MSALTVSISFSLGRSRASVLEVLKACSVAERAPHMARVGKLMRDWESQKWWDSVLPAFMATPQMTEAQKRAADAAKAGNRGGA